MKSKLLLSGYIHKNSELISSVFWITTVKTSITCTRTMLYTSIYTLMFSAYISSKTLNNVLIFYGTFVKHLALTFCHQLINIHIIRVDFHLKIHLFTKIFPLSLKVFISSTRVQFMRLVHHTAQWTLIIRLSDVNLYKDH